MRNDVDLSARIATAELVRAAIVRHHAAEGIHYDLIVEPLTSCSHPDEAREALVWRLSADPRVASGACSMVAEPISPHRLTWARMDRGTSVTTSHGERCFTLAVGRIRFAIDRSQRPTTLSCPLVFMD
ncbi:MAG: hypothetical protein O2800_03235 [Planctomycetota bacterium]|nr:hypothetical protein [Planctomycetota bacterium]